MHRPVVRDRLLHASGGLVWHWRAWRHRTLWQPFIALVRSWLLEWSAPRESLLIVGPSAGYTLDAGFLAQWPHITALEPDPLARWLLRRRFPGITWHFDALDITAPNGFTQLARHYPAHAVLFSNVLGQIMPRDSQHWHTDLRTALATRHWASYHDVISTRRPPDHDEGIASGVAEETLESVLENFWEGGEIKLVDHACFALGGPAALHEIALWHLRPGHFHLVEWHAHTPHSIITAVG